VCISSEAVVFVNNRIFRVTIVCFISHRKLREMCKIRLAVRCAYIVLVETHYV